jgi:hypothetical protein
MASTAMDRAISNGSGIAEHGEGVGEGEGGVGWGRPLLTGQRNSHLEDFITLKYQTYLKLKKHSSLSLIDI